MKRLIGVLIPSELPCESGANLTFFLYSVCRIEKLTACGVTTIEHLRRILGCALVWAQHLTRRLSFGLTVFLSLFEWATNAFCLRFSLFHNS